MMESDLVSEQQGTELPVKEIEVNNQIWEIKNDDSYIYSLDLSGISLVK